MSRVRLCDAFVDLCACVGGGDCVYVDLNQAQFYPPVSIMCFGHISTFLEAVLQMSWFLFRFRGTRVWCLESKWAC